MNLLVTNSHTPQAYAIIRALRPHANRVVAAIEGDAWLGRFAHGAHSRLVDARCRLPAAFDDWWHGQVDPGNTPGEQRYVDALLAVCERERIDVVFPSWDPYVYVLSKNLPRLAEAGITVPVPGIETVLTALDKYRTVQAGQAVGVPCPVTYLYESREQLATIVGEIGFPVVLKPRFTSGGHGMAVVKTREELESVLPGIIEKHGAPLVQEYIPGGKRDSIQLVIGRNGEVLFAFHKSRLRTFRRTARFGTVSRSARPDARLAQVSALLRKVGWWGAMGVEMMRDPRDGTDKLMEINPRFARQLWNRTELGINEPLMCIQLARGEAVPPVEPYPLGVLFVSPLEDVQLFAWQLLDLLLYNVRTRGRADRVLDSLSEPPLLRDLLRSFVSTYTSADRRVWDPYFKYFFQDPVTAMLWWLQFSTWLAGSWRQLGR
jgi:glutathione synthase/RimK-type ligase-like ATP-grasp enzyme